MLASLITVVIVVGGSILLSWPLGRYMAALFSGRFGSADGTFAKLGGSSADQDWKAYSIALLAFNAVMFAFVFALLSLQHALPLNPDGQGAASIDLVFNTAMRFYSASPHWKPNLALTPVDPSVYQR